MKTAHTPQKLEEILRREFNPSAFTLEDESYLHAGHQAAGGGGHYAVEIKSRRFNGISPLARQRLVMEAVKALFDANEVHALSLRCLPEE